MPVLGRLAASRRRVEVTHAGSATGRDTGLDSRPAGRDLGAAPGQPGPAGIRALLWLAALAALSLVVSLLYSRYLFADSYYDLYAGRYILRHGMPHRNVVTVASHGAPWIDQQWLAHVIYYGAWAAGGYPALAVLCVAARHVRVRRARPADAQPRRPADPDVSVDRRRHHRLPGQHRDPRAELRLPAVRAHAVAGRGRQPRAPAAGAHLAGRPGAGALGEYARFCRW